MRRTVTALLLLLSGAAAAIAQPAPTKQKPPKQAVAKQAPQNSHCAVGVVSGLGEKFIVKRIGFTVLGNEENEVPSARGASTT
jgi:hypothetical protein